jgi:hypothetical protein
MSDGVFHPTVPIIARLIVPGHPSLRSWIEEKPNGRKTMRIRRKLGTLACAAALGAGITVAAAGTASAGGCWPTKDTCGVVVNNTPHLIVVCWAWDGPPLNDCTYEATLSGGQRAGGNGADVDAFWVPGGHCFDWDVNGIPFPNAQPGWHRIHNGENATIHRILGC